MPSTDVPTVTGEIRAEMARQGLTLGALSDLTQPRISGSSLSRRFSGHRQFSLLEVLAICDALGVTFAEIARRAESRAA